MHYRQFLTTQGFISEAERWQLFLLASQLHRKALIVNIGVEYGASIASLRQGNPTAQLWGIDLDTSKSPTGIATALSQGDSYEIGKTRLEMRIALKEEAHLIDLLFIDGDHTYQGVKRDIEVWLPQMAYGSIIAFHDCNSSQCEGVTRAVSEWFAGAMGWVELPRAGAIRTFQHTQPLAVLIPTYKRAHIVSRTVDCILSNLRHNGQVIIYVGDDSGDTETKAALRGYPSTQHVPSPRKGLGANLNYLLSITREPLIVQLDDDHQLVRCLDLRPHADKLIREKDAGWIHLMLNARFNEDWDVSDFALRGDDLRHWRIMPDSPCKFLASNQPHIKTRKVHDVYGTYQEAEKTWQAETEFNERVQRMHKAKPDTTPRFYVPVEAYGFSHWEHVGDSYAKRGL